MQKPKIIIIGGQTATGKTALALKLAREFNGELVSADSRQVYQGMNVVTGKDVGKSKYHLVKNQEKNLRLQIGYYVCRGVKIWLYDIVDPSYQFNVGEYQNLAEKVIEDIVKRGKIPIIVGGTGLYLRSLITTLDKVSVKPDWKLRGRLASYPVANLQKELARVDNKKLAGMNNSDRNNPRRLVRAIELGLSGEKKRTKKKKFSYLGIILKTSGNDLTKKITARVKKRIDGGALKETQSLLSVGYDFTLNSFTATGYSQLELYFKGQKTLDEVRYLWLKSELNYAKKQLVFFKKFLGSQQGFIWFDISDGQLYTRVENSICRFLKKPLS